SDITDPTTQGDPVTATPDQHRNPVRITFNRRRFVAGAAALGATGLVLPASSAAQQALPETGLPSGTVLVASNRLPLPGVAAADVQSLVQGAIGNWRDAGAPVGLAP